MPAQRHNLSSQTAPWEGLRAEGGLVRTCSFLFLLLPMKRGFKGESRRIAVTKAETAASTEVFSLQRRSKRPDEAEKTPGRRHRTPSVKENNQQGVLI